MTTYQQRFINAVAPAAVAAYREHGISAAFTIAQGADESGWGRFAPHNALFGVKSDPSWKGDTYEALTKEYNATTNTWVTLVQRFRAYPNIGASLADHVAFLLENSRYRNLIGADYATACNEIAKVDHYATDPTYGTKLIEIIREYGLAKFDDMPKPTPVSHPATKHPYPTLIRGSKYRTYVVALQTVLNRYGAHPQISVDGVFGAGTLSAVKRFQRAHKLASDGIVGSATWTALGY